MNTTAKLLLKREASAEVSPVLCDGERVRLVPATAEFGDEIFQEFTPEITRYMVPKPCKDRAGVDKVLEIFASQRSRGSDLVFAITLKTTGEFLGCCGIHASLSPRLPELGVWIKSSAHGHGYGRESIHTLVVLALRHLDLDGFRYSVDKRNIASVKIPQSLGGFVIEEKKVTSMSGNELDEFVFLIPKS